MPEVAAYLVLECVLCGADLGTAWSGQKVASTIGPHLTSCHAFTAYGVADLNYFAWSGGYQFTKDDGTVIVRGKWLDA